MSIGESVDAYLNAMKSRNFSIKSLRSWRDRLKRLQGFANEKGVERVQDVTPEHLEEYRRMLVENGLKEMSVGHYLRTVKSFFGYLEETQEIFVSPAEDVTIPRPKSKLLQVPSEEEMLKVLAVPDVSTAAGVRNRALLETAYSTGLRLAELAGLNVGDPDMKERTVRVIGKGAKERVVPLGKVAIEWLEKYVTGARRKLLSEARPDEPALWLSLRGGRLCPVAIEIVFRRSGQQAGIGCPLSPHSVRRACVTHMLRGGAHPVQIQTLLGHSSLYVLSQYLKVTHGDLLEMHRKSKVGE